MPTWTSEQQKERVRRRVRAAVDPDSYVYTPEKEKTEHADTDRFLRVAIYARVSTLNPLQTTSFELQQKYYEDLVSRYPKWTLYKIYADEGKSGVTIKERDGFNEMMRDADEGKFDLIIVKSISRLARNVIILLKTVRRLAEKKIGVLFESEAVYSLNDQNHLALTFQATVAEEESRIRSRSMESSLRMRLDHGLPLTPELLGFKKNEDGKLIINPETYKIPKLMFAMYLYGYSTQQIADKLTKLSKRTYLGNLKWSANGIARSLQNERYCGDVRTRKRFKIFAADVENQKTFKNRGEKPQSYYKNEHEAIVSRDDFLAVQRIMQNAKYGGNSLLPKLRVIPEGLLKGYVVVHPRWGSFKMEDYIRASETVDQEDTPAEILVEAEKGSFDLRGYEVVDFKLIDELRVPAISLQRDDIKFSSSCVRDMACGDYVELLVHPKKKKLAIRPSTKENKCAIQWTKDKKPRKIACKAYIDTLFQLFCWKPDYKYKLYGCVYRDGEESACIFSTEDASVFIQRETLLSEMGDGGAETGEEKEAVTTGHLCNSSGKRIRAVTGDLGARFGNEFYVERTLNELEYLTGDQWLTRIEGQLCELGSELNITPYAELRAFIQQELGDLFEEEETE